MPEQEVRIINKLGLHARASAKLAATAGRFVADVLLIKDDITVNAKSIMGIMMLAATSGSTLRIRTTGDDAEQALQAIVQLIENRFGENE